MQVLSYLLKICQTFSTSSNFNLTKGILKGLEDALLLVFEKTLSESAQLTDQCQGKTNRKLLITKMDWLSWYRNSVNMHESINLSVVLSVIWIFLMCSCDVNVICLCYSIIWNSTTIVYFNEVFFLTKKKEKRKKK